MSDENRLDRAKKQRGLRAEYSRLPLVYSCSGCSSAAQLANSLAVRLDRDKLAEMSCVVGVGGDVAALLKTARSQRKIMVLDGCPLHCAKSCLERHEISPAVHIDLSKCGVKKAFHSEATPEEAERVWEQNILPAISKLQQ